MDFREATVVVAGQVELEAWAAALMLQLGPTASTAMVEQLVMAELAVLVRTERRE